MSAPKPPPPRPLTVRAARDLVAAAGLGRVPEGPVVGTMVGSAVAVGGPGQESPDVFHALVYADDRGGEDAALAALAVSRAGFEMGYDRALARLAPGARPRAMKQAAGWSIFEESDEATWWGADRPSRPSSAGRAVPLSKREADEWVARVHRHLPPSVGALFSVGVLDQQGALRCVAQASLPRSRVLMQASGGVAAEVVRVACDGMPNAPSMALGAVARALVAVGYRRLISYTALGTESGRSYLAAGWRPVALSRGGEWDRSGRARARAVQPNRKVRWESGPDAARLPEAEERELRAIVLGLAPSRRENPRAQRRRTTASMRPGTLVFHGTSAEEDFEDLDGPAWVSRERSVAEYFVKWHEGPKPRIITYRVTRPQKLRVFRDSTSIDRFMERRLGHDFEWDRDAIVDEVCSGSGRYDGWVIPENYSPGDDTMLCDPGSVLEYVSSEPFVTSAEGG